MLRQQTDEELKFVVTERELQAIVAKAIIAGGCALTVLELKDQVNRLIGEALRDGSEA